MPRLWPAYLGAMPVARLSSRALIAVTGPESRPFLHNLLTQDVETLGEGELRFGALLSPPGRLLFDLFILGQAEGVLLDVAADRRDALIQRLSMYKLRARVQVAADDRPVFAAWPDAPTGFIPDPRTPLMGGRRYGEAEADATEADYDAHRLSVGVPDPIKGEAVVCFVTLHDKRSGQEGWSVWETELSDHVARLLGKPLRPARIHALTQIPKTRNGKILRRVVRNAYIGRPMGDLSSMENPRSIDEVIGLRAARV